MYGRIVGSSSQSPNASQADESEEAGDSPRFAETLSDVGSGGSSPALYFLASDPPIDDITESSFNAGLRRFLGDDIRQIARNPQEYSDFVSKKAERAAIVAGGYRSTHYDPTRPARFYSYQLGNETVGLLRAGGPVLIDREDFRQQFGRNDITSVVDLRVTHPLAENAGDILLEHQLRKDGADPLILSNPALPGMEPRLAEMGFVHWDENNWVLDPHQHPEVWTKNDNNEWQRVGKPTKYLAKVDDGDTATEEWNSSDDDPSFYLERALAGLSME
ncbi:Effector protein NopP [Bradyrhizobium ivorense]|uniref:Effector protein NopP n=1 Tax=Bradyrhizobium ivorense TaxID=2511166 RepID=A0A508T1E6_9BRAD|nr:host specificity protein [Bradyrhizobium ivorense]VIO68653.1 Effector protein NopP [Bradyrhizobium ivorense]VIO69309.1 Effector protein NopP [Bradyrhizobium ivorense]